MRLIDGCERLLELQLTNANEIEVLKSKKRKYGCIWSGELRARPSYKFGHHLLEKNWHTREIENCRVWYVTLLLLAMSFEEGVFTYTSPVEAFVTGIKNLDQWKSSLIAWSLCSKALDCLILREFKGQNIAAPAKYLRKCIDQLILVTQNTSWSLDRPLKRMLTASPFWFRSQTLLQATSMWLPFVEGYQ